MNPYCKTTCFIIVILLQFELQAKKIEFYGFYPVWQNKSEKIYVVDDIQRAFGSLLYSGSKTQGQKLETLDNLFYLVEKIENPNKFREETECILGFYFRNKYEDYILDVFFFSGKHLLISSSRRVHINAGSGLQDISKIAELLYYRTDSLYLPDISRNLLFHYLLPYQAEYFSRSKYEPGWDSSKIARLDLSEPMKINGKINPRIIFNEIDKAFYTNVPTVFHKPNGYGLLDVYKSISPNKPNEYKKYHRNYRRFFDGKYPVMLQYAEVASAYEKYKKEPNNSPKKEDYRQEFKGALRRFLNTIDSGNLTPKETAVFKKYGYDIPQVRTDLVIRADQILKCDQNLSLAEKAEENGDINQAIYHYYNLIKFCGGKPNYEKFADLAHKKDSIYETYLKLSHNLESEGMIQEAIDVFIKAQKILPYMPDHSKRLDSLRVKLAERNKDLSAEMQRARDLDVSAKIIEAKLEDIIYNTYKYKVVGRTVSVKRKEQSIYIVFNTEDIELDLITEVAYYPNGKYTYDMDDIDNNFIANSIYIISDHFSKTNDKNERILPEIMVKFEGSADLTNYSGAVENDGIFTQTDEAVISCTDQRKTRRFSDLCKQDATKYDKNLALALLRASYKEKKILSRCGHLIAKTEKCGKVIEGGSVADRAVVVTVQVTMN